MRSTHLCLTLLFTASFVSPALAAWPNSPFTNLALCTAAGDQFNPMIVSDGAGGVIVAWQDRRNGVTYDIHAQHVLASGAADVAWPANGRAVCSAANDQVNPTLVSDGAGGAIVTWSDLRSGTYDIYAQHVLASGAVDGAWPADGRALCTAANAQSYPVLVPDGAGGAVVAWTDTRAGVNDIYAQHVLASGAVDGAWPANGRALCTAANDQSSPTIVSDGAGGAIVTWNDARGGAGYDIYAQHVLLSGAVDGAWPADGRALSAAANDQAYPTIVSDGGGGAIVTWQDHRVGSPDIYAAHVLASGAVDAAWPANGRALCTAASLQNTPTIASDGAGGAIVAWYDFRSGAAYDVYAQHVQASGTVDGSWPVDGRALCTAPFDQFSPTIASDGSGGAIVTWFDSRSGAGFDVYAQHVLASGVVDGVWPVNGRALSVTGGNQSSPMVISDGAGGAIVTWHDSRNGNYDVFAQRVARFGYLGTPEAEISDVGDVPGDQGGRVKLSWTASYLDLASDANLTTYDIWRSVPANIAAARLERGERVAASYAEALADRGRLWVEPTAAQYAWEYVATQAAYHYISSYSVLAPTAQDSTPAGAPRTAFMVVARNATNTMYWPSFPDSGYSVDNLAPAAPQFFTGQYAGGTVSLHWVPNTEADLAGYLLYRGTSPAFVPGPGNLVATPPDTGYADAPGVPSYYKLAAVDAHGNVSGYTLLTPQGTTDVGDGGGALAFALEGARPNPARAGRLSVAFTLPTAAPARLEVIDLAGRLVAARDVGALGAGRHVVELGSGTRLAPGVYVLRVSQGGASRSVRATVLE